MTTSKYSKSLSDRLRIQGAAEGTCAICRTSGRLTLDHVPPKKCGNANDSIIRSLAHDPSHQVSKTLMSQGGTTSRKICAYCNNTRLGSDYDPALIDLFNQITDYIKHVNSTGLTVADTHGFRCQTNKFLRAIVGHLLAATSANEVSPTNKRTPLDDALRDYFLNPGMPFPKPAKIYYWLYPFTRRVTMKHASLGFFGEKGQEPIYGHVFKFFPFGFWIVWDEQDDRSASFGLRSLRPSLDIDAVSDVTFDLKPLQASTFPEMPMANTAWFYV